MEIIYYIKKNDTYERVTREVYDNWDGDKKIRSGFSWIYPDGTELNMSTLFLPLRYI